MYPYFALTDFGVSFNGLTYSIYFVMFSSTDGWDDRWISSTHKGAEQGKFEHSAGKFYGDAEKDKGEQILQHRTTHCLKLGNELQLTSESLQGASTEI